MRMRLEREGSWDWRGGDSDTHGLYLVARVSPRVRLRVIDEGGDKYLFVVGVWPEALPLHKKIREEILPLLEARNIQDAESPD
jgi:hypothetical protein